MNTCLSVQNLNVSIKRRNILSDISFDISEGEIVGMLGPNGSGKTTTIRTIAGLIKKSSGSICAFSHDADKDFEQYICRISFGFDKAGYYPNLSGFDNLKLFTNLYANTGKKEIIECAEKVGLGKRISDKVSSYSFGMRQRLNFARALLASSGLVVLDEPFNGIDPEGVVEMRGLISELQTQKGTAFLVSSHMLDELESISDRLLFYKGGVLRRDVSVKDNLSYCHYIRIANPNSQIGELLVAFSAEVETDDCSLIKHNCNESNLNEFLSALQSRGLVISSVSSKRAIEDLYLKTVGGGEIE